MKILITGAAGYIGTKLTELLLKQEKNWEITGVDNFYHGNNLAILPFLNHHKYEFKKVDLLDAEKISLLEPWKYDCIVHLAALVGFPICEEHQSYASTINHYSTMGFGSCIKGKKTFFVYPTTNSGYGTTDGKTECTEETELRPVSYYGKTKMLSEMYLQNTLRENSVSLRLATVFGSSYRLRNDLLVNSFVWKAYKDKYNVIYDGNAMRNYIHIYDVCRAIHWCILNEHLTRGQIFNVGNDALNMSKLQLANKINEFIPHKILEGNVGEDMDKRNYIVSSKKIYNLGFQCCYDLEHGIKELHKMYKAIDVPHNANY